MLHVRENLCDAGGLARALVREETIDDDVERVASFQKGRDLRRNAAPGFDERKWLTEQNVALPARERS